MMRLDLKEIAGSYPTGLMEWELTIHLGRKSMNAGWGESIIAKAPIHAISPLKGIGEVEVSGPGRTESNLQGEYW
jgi:hypothetical protein